MWESRCVLTFLRLSFFLLSWEDPHSFADSTSQVYNQANQADSRESPAFQKKTSGRSSLVPSLDQFQGWLTFPFPWSINIPTEGLRSNVKLLNAQILRSSEAARSQHQHR